MLLTFFSLTLSYDIQKIGFCSWSGHNCILDRILPNSQTWYQFLPEVHVYTESMPKDSEKTVMNSNNHLNLKFHILPLRTFALIGTEFDTEWNHAQSRHIVAIDHFYRNNKDKEWYAIFDDDTYIFVENLLRFLDDKNSSIPVVYGVSYGAVSYAGPFFKTNGYHSFIHGGSSIIMSKAFIEKVGSYFLNCSAIFNLANVGSDIRLGMCMERYIGPQYNDLLKPDVNRFFPDIPENVVDKRNEHKPQITYHHIHTDRAFWMWNCSTSMWTSKQGEDLYIDWSIFSTQPYEVSIDRDGQLMKFHWGYKICFDSIDKPNCFRSKSPIIPQFKNDDNSRDDPQMFTQSFENDLKVIYKCDKDMQPGDVAQERYFSGEESGFVLRAHCYKPKKFMHNHPGTTSPVSVKIEELNDL